MSGYSNFRSNPNTKSSKDYYDSQQHYSKQEFISQDASMNRMSRGDIKPEVHFIGQITGGVDFGTSDGLFCEMILEIEEPWKIISPPRLYQTQTSYANTGFMHVWNHPIDLHLAANDLSYWPKANFKVWRLDSSNKIDIFSYGVCILPKKSGYSKLVCETWSPTGVSYSKTNFDALSFYMGNKPRLQSIDIISKDLEKRKTLNTQSSGKIIVEIECLMKNFELLDISGQTD